MVVSFNGAARHATVFLWEFEGASRTRHIFSKFSQSPVLHLMSPGGGVVSANGSY